MALSARQSVISLNESVPVYRYRYYTGVDFPLSPLKDRTIYRRRWIIVMIFSVFALIQGVEWNSWWYISDASQTLYRWTDVSVILLGAVGAISFAFSLIPVAKIVQSFGQRSVVIQACFLLAIGAFVRYWFATNSQSFVLSIVSSIVIGISGAAAFVGPTVISAAWFPRHERFLATGIMTLVGTTLSMCGSFLLGDCFIPDIVPNETLDNVTIHSLEKELDGFYLVEFIVCLVICVTILSYFPNYPPTPSTYSSLLPRLPFVLGVREALSNQSFWCVLIARAVPSGMHAFLLRALHIDLEVLNLTAHENTWLGPSACMVGFVGGLGFCFLADRMPYRIRYILIFLNAASGIASLIIVLTCSHILTTGLQTTHTLFLVFVISVSLFSTPTAPLYAELACEVAHPTSEATVQSLHGMVAAAAWAICFSLIPFDGFWILVALTTSFFSSIPLLLCVQQQLFRANEDESNGI